MLHREISNYEGAKKDAQDTLTGDTQSFGGEERPDSLPGKTSKLSHEDLACAELLTGHKLGVPTYFVQDIHGQPSFASVLVGNTVDGSHCFGLASPGEEVLW